MANCDKCTNRATQILSVGSLGRVETLCQNHIQQAVLPLDAALVPYQLTGTESSFSAEQSLEQRVLQLDNERKQLRNELDDARKENKRLSEVLLERLGQHNEDLRNELDEVKAQNEDFGREPQTVEG